MNLNYDFPQKAISSNKFKLFFAHLRAQLNRGGDTSKQKTNKKHERCNRRACIPTHTQNTKYIQIPQVREKQIAFHQRIHAVFSALAADHIHAVQSWWNHHRPSATTNDIDWWTYLKWPSLTKEMGPEHRLPKVDLLCLSSYFYSNIFKKPMMVNSHDYHGVRLKVTCPICVKSYDWSNFNHHMG